ATPALCVCGLPTTFGSRRIFTGTRWTTFTQLPVAFSGGSREKRAPVPAATELTTPVKVFSGNPSTRISARWPARMRASCVSFRFASTHTSWSGTIASRGWPICTICPTSTERFETLPSSGARISVCRSCSSANARSAWVSFRRASARLTSASFIATWWVWLVACASDARSSATRCLAWSTACRRAASSASACWTSRSVAVSRRRVARGAGRPRLGDPGLVVAGVHADQQLAPLHQLVVAHVKLDDGARDFRADGRDGALDVGVVGPDVVGGLVPRVGAVAQGEHADHGAEAQDEAHPHGPGASLASSVAAL